MTRPTSVVTFLCVAMCLLPFVAGVKQTEVILEQYTEDGGLDLRTFLQNAVRDGILTKTQHSELLARAEGKNILLSEIVIKKSTNIEKNSVFIRMYNQFTLLNVIYFSGALLVIGAYTLFMTLAWERLGGAGIAAVMCAQSLASGVMGTQLWLNTTDYQFLGGLLCSISTGLVPFAVYGVQRYLNVWPKEDPGVFQGFRLYVRPGWVAMEVATVIVGFSYIAFVRFPFLMAPVSFSLWFLSMDIAPLLPRWDRHNSWEIRRKVSLTVGLSMIFGGRLTEVILGSEPDFGFWLYLFGLLAFWFSLTFDFPEQALNVSMYLLINVCLVLVGSRLDRYTFKVFGTFGLLMVLYGLFSARVRMVKTESLWLLKSLATVALLAQAMKVGGNVELLAGLVCFLAFNMVSVLYAFRASEIKCFFILVTNLGFTICALSFSRPFYLYLFSINAEIVLSFCFSLSVAIFHIRPIVMYYTREGSQNWSMKTALYLFYRTVISTVIAIFFVICNQQHYAWVGGLGIVLSAAAYPNKFHHFNQNRPALLPITGAFIVYVFGVWFAIYLQSNILYLMCCLGLIHYFVVSFACARVFGCLLSIGLILISVPLQSKFLITIGAIYIFLYLSYLAYEVFSGSLTFPLVLVALGFVLIGTGTMYQSQQEAVYKLFINLLPQFAQHSQLAISNLGFPDVYGHIKDSSFSLEYTSSSSIVWLLWSASLMHALAKEPMPYVWYMCLFGILATLVVMIFFRIQSKLTRDLSASIKVETLTVELCPVSGFVAKITGIKESNLDVKTSYIALNIESDLFWVAISRYYSKLLINIIRSSFFPYKLTPHLIQLEDFQKNSRQFSATINFGTGVHGTQKISKGTILSAASKLKQIPHHIEFVILYSTTWYRPYSTLCLHSEPFNHLCEQLLDNKQQ